MVFPAAELERLVDDARPAVFWTDRDGAPEAAPALTGNTVADLVIIGAGFTGLWAALQAIEDDPQRDVVVLEAETAGFGASTRNGGFCEASLTHGLGNGLAHWPREIRTLLRMGHENLAELLETTDRHGIDIAAEHTGQIEFAVAQWQVDDLREGVADAGEYGEQLEFFDAGEAQRLVHSPTYLAASWDRRGAVMIDPALLTWGLRRTCERLGVRFFEESRVLDVRDDSGELIVVTDAGLVRTPKAIAATNAWAEPVSKMRRYVIPIYDHVLMTEPLSTEQMRSIGWDGRQGLADSGNQFHYYRLTADDRILWGGYDANYHRGNAMGTQVEARTASHVVIAGHFFETFPQLEGLGFSHRWAGPIGTTSKFTAAFDTAFDGKLAWAAGYTGLGVGASRWGARVALDLIDGRTTERTELGMVRRKPMPFPPEPFRYPIIQFTRSQIARADSNGGKQGPWLKLLDAIGVGFDS